MRGVSVTQRDHFPRGRRTTRVCHFSGDMMVLKGTVGWVRLKICRCRSAVPTTIKG